MDDYRALFIKKRMEKGISQRKFAVMIGITQTFMSEIERGRKTPSLQTFFKICEVLEIKVFPDEDLENLHAAMGENTPDS